MEASHAVHLVDMPAGYAMLDTGCRAPVAGQTWHEALQGELRKLDLEFTSDTNPEHFRFGDGATVTSRRGWTYPLAVGGQCAAIRIAEVPGSLPGLLGPDAIAQFKIQLDFAKSRWRTRGAHWRPFQWTESGHIRLPILQHSHVLHAEADSDDDQLETASEQSDVGSSQEPDDSGDSLSNEGDSQSSSTESNHEYSSQLCTGSSENSSSSHAEE
jgi:hypothetical protein